MRQVSVSEAFKRKYPEQIALAVSADADGRPDVITLGWAMSTSNEPPMVAISVGHTRHSHELIAKSGEFVLAFPAPELAEACLLCGTKSGRDTDKIAAAGLAPVPARLVKPPLLAKCVVNLECKVRGSLVTGDHTIFAGEIVAAYIDESVSERLCNFGGKFCAARPKA